MATALQTVAIASPSALGCRRIPASSGSVCSSLAFPQSQGLRATRVPGRVAQSSTQRYSVKTIRKVSCEAQETITGAGPVTDGTFKELVLDSPVPVLVDFWAPWCGPCRMIAPLIDELSKQYAGKLTCLKLNTDESPGVATEYGIRSIPTVMIFKGGKKLDTVIGAVPKTTLTTTIEKYLD